MFSSPKKRIEKYLQKNPDIKSIVIMGSYGRKSAIHALASILGQELVVTMGINKDIHPDVVILDYRSMQDFPDIQPDVAVITSCKTEAEAQEFFTLANKSKQIVLNFNDVPQEFAKFLANPHITTYGDERPSDYYFENHNFNLEGYEGDFVNPEREHIPVKLQILGEHNIRPVIMAVAVAKLFKLSRQDIVEACESLHSLNGRMQPCRGLNNALVIDDSADISDVSVFYGLRTIYSIDAPSRIVVTNSLEKLADFSQSLIDQVVVLGQPVEHKIKNTKIKFFDDELSMINYLGKNFEENGIVLLEIPLPEIIESRIWQ